MARINANCSACKNDRASKLTAKYFIEENEDDYKSSAFEEGGYSFFFSGKYTLNFPVNCHELFSFLRLSVFYSVRDFQ